MRDTTRTSRAGTWGKPAGFTLIELAVVMAILAIGVGLTISLMESAFYGNDFKTSLRRMQGIVNSVRYEAMLDGLAYELVLETGSLPDQDRGRYWIVPKGIEPAQPPAGRPLFRDGSTRLLRVETGRTEDDGSGTVHLSFAANGLAEEARIHILAGGRRYVLVQEPFLARLKVQGKRGAATAGTRGF